MIKISKKRLAEMWLSLNAWRAPKGFELHIDNQDKVRGAFAIVNSLISFKEIKKMKIKRIKML